MKMIPTFVHGILDYIVGLVLIVAPNLFGFADLGGPAVAIPRVIGILALVQSLLTNYELGVLKILPMRFHLGMDYLLMLVLAASPWLFGFYHQPNNVWLPHVVVGIAGFLLTLLTESVPRERTIHTHSPAH